jgi:hypothetical protein
MNLISYSTRPNGEIFVHLGKRKVGRIKQGLDGSWRYLPGGSNRKSGKPFPTLAECKASLEAE